MSRKSAEKTNARDVQALTGMSYQSALQLVRKWKEEGKQAREEIAKLAELANRSEDK